MTVSRSGPQGRRRWSICTLLYVYLRGYWDSASPGYDKAATLTQCPFEVAALGTFGTDQRVAGAAPFLGGAAYAVFALAGACAEIKSASIARTLESAGIRMFRNWEV